MTMQDRTGFKDGAGGFRCVLHKPTHVRQIGAPLEYKPVSDPQVVHLAMLQLPM